MAAPTAQNIIDRVRRLLEDRGPTTRWKDAEILNFINDGQREILNRRPDAAFDDSSLTVADPTDVSDGTGTLAIADSFVSALADYVASRCQQKRVEYADPERATMHWNLFVGALK